MKYEYTVTHNHELSLDVAKSRLENLAVNLEAKYGGQLKEGHSAVWVSPNQYDLKLKAVLGPMVTGSITLDDTLVTVTYSHNSFMFDKANGTVEKKILGRLEKWFGEEDPKA